MDTNVIATNNNNDVEENADVTMMIPDTWMFCSWPKLIILELVFMASPEVGFRGQSSSTGARDIGKGNFTAMVAF